MLKKILSGFTILLLILLSLRSFFCVVVYMKNTGETSYGVDSLFFISLFWVLLFNFLLRPSQEAQER